MNWKYAIFITSAWFGLGLGLARAELIAHACSCVGPNYLALERESIDASVPDVAGALADEEAYWPTSLYFYNSDGVVDGVLTMAYGEWAIGLRRVP
jgi:hypothetical protein